MSNDKPKTTPEDARKLLGDPATMDRDAQHDQLAAYLYKAMELAQIAGYHERVIAQAGAVATAGFMHFYSASTLDEIVDIFRRTADSVEASADADPNQTVQ